MRIILTILTLWLCASQALAGAWPRAKGSGFVSVSNRLSWPQNTDHWTSSEPTDRYSTIYLEYGASDRLTLGLDLGHSVSGAGKTLIFAQLPVFARDQSWHMTGQMGFGEIERRATLRPGLALGRGLPQGWLSLETMAEIALENKETDYKLDLTYGRNLREDQKLIIQIQTGLPEGEEGFVRLAPSYVRPFGKRLKLEQGVTYGLRGDSSMGVKLGLWADF
jgi:hypothetical protein